MGLKWQDVAPAQIDTRQHESIARSSNLMKSALKRIGGIAKPDREPNGPDYADYSEPNYTAQRDQSSREDFSRISGYGQNVPRGLVASESSGDWGARNNAKGSSGKRGHFGQLQFGHDRLLDAKRAGIIPTDTTPEQFMADPQMQIRTANWHFDDIDKRIFSNGLDSYLGKVVGGVNVTMDGMRSMAHLGGMGGLMAFLRTNGADNRNDGSTSLSDYGKKFDQ